jgi:hypothetical protein
MKMIISKGTKIIIYLIIVLYFVNVAFGFDLTDLSACWSFNTGNGTVADNNEAISLYTYGNPTLNSSCTLDGSCWSFDGNDYLSVLDDADFNVGSGEFTLVAWIKTTTAGATKGIQAKGTTGKGGKRYELYVHGSGYGFFNLDDNAASKELVGSVVPVEDEEWHMVVGVRNASVFALIVDTVVDTTSSSSGYGSLDAAGSIYHIGAGADSSLNFQGNIDEVSVWKRALTSQEIQTLYNGGTPFACENNFQNPIVDTSPPLLSNPICTTCFEGTNTTNSTPSINLTCTDYTGCQMVRISNSSAYDFLTATSTRNCTKGSGDTWTCALPESDQLTQGEHILYFWGNDTLNNYHTPYNLSINVNLISSRLSIEPVYPTTNINVTQNEFFNYTVNVCCSESNCGGINVSLDPEVIKEKPKENSEYFFNGKLTLNKDSTITRTIGGQLYADSKGTRLQDTPSLKDCEYCNNLKLIIKQDLKYPLKEKDILDYYYINDTDMIIVLNLTLSSTEFNKDVPIKSYQIGNESKVAYQTTFNLKSVAENQILALPFGPDKEIKIGDKSTTITLDNPSTDIVANLYITPEYQYYGSMIKIDISSIPSGQSILNSSLCLSPTTILTGDEDAKLLRILDQTWDESTSTSTINAQSFDNEVTDKTFSQIVENEYSCINVSQQTIADYDDSNQYLSLRIEDLDYPIGTISYKDAALFIGAGEADGISFEDRANNYGTGLTPYLQINYEPVSPPAQEGKTGLVNTTTGGIPFYTNMSNPQNITLAKDDCIEVTWWVNATGTIGTNHTFYAYANITSTPNINNITPTLNITIISGAGPCDCPSPASDWQIECSDNCDLPTCDITGHNLFINGNSGKTTIYNDLYVNDVYWEKGCEIYYDINKIYQQKT